MSVLDDVLTAEVQLIKPTAKTWWKVVIVEGKTRTYSCMLCRERIVSCTMRSKGNQLVNDCLKEHAQKHADEAFAQLTQENVTKGR